LYSKAFFLLFTTLIFQGCLEKDLKVNLNQEAAIYVSPPSDLRMENLLLAPTADDDVEFIMSNIQAEDIITLYDDSSCTNQLTTVTSTNTTTNLTTPAFSYGENNLYGKITRSNSTSECSDSLYTYFLKPLPPSSLTLFSPSASSGTNESPVITIEGLNSGDTVRLYSDAACTSLLGTATAITSTLNITSSALALGVHNFYSSLTREDIDSDCSSASASYTLVPNAPSSLVLNSPSTSPSTDSTPTITVGGVQTNDTVKIFTDSNCTQEVASENPSSSTVDLSSSTLSYGDYNFYASLTRSSYTSACSTATVAYRYVPTAPTSISKRSPTSSSGTDDTLEVRIYGVSNGDTVTLYQDSSCSTQVATGTSTSSFINLTTSSLDRGSYSFYAKRERSGVSSSCSSASTSYAVVPSFSTIGKWGGDFVVATAIDSNTLYASDVSIGLIIFDISTPSSPTVISQMDNVGSLKDILISGNYAYLADSENDSLHVVNISDTANPTLETSLVVSGIPTNMAIDGNNLYLASGSEGIHIIDISTPTSPTLVTTYSTDNAYDITISGTNAYVADGPTGLKVLDITDISNPSVISSLDTSGTAYGVIISGTNAFISSTNAGMQIVDITTPSAPALTSTYDSSGRVHKVKVVGNTAYIADDFRGIRIVDISDATSPTLTSTLSTVDKAVDLSILGNNIFIADSIGGIQVVNISTPESPSQIAAYNQSSIIRKVALSNDYAYLSDESLGLQILNITNPSAPTHTSTISLTSNTYDTFISGNYAFIANGSNGLQIVDITDPTTPSLLHTVDTPGQARGVSVTGNYAYVADYSSGIQIIDISTLPSTQPTIVGTYNTSGTATHVVAIGDYAFIADGNNGLVVLNISSPSSPTLVDSYDTPGSASRVQIVGDLAFIADTSGGLQIINLNDVTNPNSISLHASLATENQANDLQIIDDLVYVADNSSGLTLIDISDSLNPNLVVNYEPEIAQCYGLAVDSDENIYMAGSQNGMVVVTYD